MLSIKNLSLTAIAAFLSFSQSSNALATETSRTYTVNITAHDLDIDIARRSLLSFTSTNSTETYYEKRETEVFGNCDSWHVPEHDRNMTLKLMEAWCDEGDDGHNIAYSHDIRFFEYGKARAFFCSWGGKNPCSSCEIRQVMKKAGVKKNCELRQGFVVNLPGWKKAYGVTGIHNSLAGLAVCNGHFTG